MMAQRVETNFIVLAALAPLSLQVTGSQVYLPAYKPCIQLQVDNHFYYLTQP